MSCLILDIESTCADDAAAHLPVLTPPATYSKADSIARWLAEAQAEQLDRAGLDYDLCRIVAVGLAMADGGTPLILVNQDERSMIELVAGSVEDADRVLGFAVVGFDLRVLTRRAALLGVPFPVLELGRYRYDRRITDLQNVLSFGDGPQKGKSLDWYCRRFGLPVPEDGVTGAEIARLVREENWPAIQQHVLADLVRTRMLAQRIGVLK